MSLRVEALGCSVPGEGSAPRWLVKDLDLPAAPGTITVLVGPNGSGKTTVLRTLVGLREPSAGRVTLDGTAIDALPRRERARAIAYLPQSTPLYHDLTVSQLVGLGRLPHAGPLGTPHPDDGEAIRTALADVGLAALAGRGVFSLSGGEFQRTLLARMLATRAPVLVLDEPTTALDIGQALDFLEQCRTLAARGNRIVLAVHDLELARRYADTAVLLAADGSGAVDVGPPAEALRPERLAEVFRVSVRAGADGLVFGPRGPR